ncbi:putative glutathione S-transferase DHAR2, chloroplastic [Schistosoma japonicum]|nr:putative glutathione S-transferase DHAR2, chloroplastic [Schistosoma japonicum]KAH8858618.1 putative glutathione S-transferase DHAR2, chloroplastic [Schistosoma japonicum]
MMHLKNGDPEPSINPARYTLFAYGFCPFCERVRLTLSFHKIDYDLILVSLLIKPDWLVKYSPMGKVPLLIHHGEKLLESDLIMRFIDELHGEKTSLMTVCGIENFQKAAELAKKFFGPGHSILYETDLNESDVVQFYEACSELENSLKSKYFTGDQLSLADLVLFPLIDYFEVVILSVIHNIELDHVHELKMSDALNEANKWPNLVNYLTTMRQESFVVNIRKSTRIKAKYASSKRAGCPNPEIQ